MRHQQTVPILFDAARLALERRGHIAQAQCLGHVLGNFGIMIMGLFVAPSVELNAAHDHFAGVIDRKELPCIAAP